MPSREQLQAVSFAVRPAVVGRYLGELLLAVGVLSLAPVLVACGFGQFAAAAALGGFAAAALAVAALLRRIPAAERVQANEAMVVAAAIFAIVPVGALVPFMAFADLGFLDALFEAVSAVTTTGLTTVADLESRSESFFFTRAWMQWYGGLGMITLAAALVGVPGLAMRRLAMPGGELSSESVRLHARRMVRIYGVLTVAGVLALLLAGAAPFDSLVHALAGVSTGGFSNHQTSLAGLGGWPVQAVATGIGLCGAVSLPLYDRVRRLGVRALAADAEFHALCAACLGASALLGLLLVGESQLALQPALRHATLLAVSAQTTTGFTPIPIGEIGPAAKLVLIASMLSGGSLGSTAGGVKLLRVLIAFRLLHWVMQRTRLAPHAVSEPRIRGEGLAGAEIQRASVVILLFLLVVGISWLPFVAMGYDPLDALFEVASATGTVGLSTGITSSSLEAPLKLILCADMLLGRVEIVALLVALSPASWRGRRAV